MPPSKPDTVSGLILLPTILPKGKEQEPVAIPNFNPTAEALGSLQKQFRFGDFERGHSLHVVEKVYDGFYAGERKGLGNSGSGFLGIKYKLNTEIPKTLEEIMKTKTADCDELMRAAFSFAHENGVRGLMIAEMTWIDQTTGKLDGHAVLVLRPDESNKFPLLFDLTYLRRGETLEYESMGVSLRKKYAEEAKNPGFKIKYLKTIEEVEASHYVRVGFSYVQKGQMITAVAAYERAAQMQPADFQINRDLAFAYKEDKNYEKALAQLTKVASITEGKKDAEVWANIGLIRLDRNLTEEAIDALKVAYALKPDEKLKIRIEHNLSAAYLWKGKKEAKAGQLEKALESYKEARYYSPQDIEIENTIKGLEKRIKGQN